MTRVPSSDDRGAGTCPFCGAQAPPHVATDITRAERAAIRVAKVVASWRFVGSVLGAALAWVVLNVAVIRIPPFPAVMISGLAAGLALLAALYGPVVLLTQRVEGQRDRERARATLAAVLEVEAVCIDGRSRSGAHPPQR
ncbi:MULTISPECIES: DUF1003 domain-containing protein [unclassified Microbacterium]|uniref:DUF1003 domain-containing protein n=1 Tax=unclassified Microbacterium TaxID=2609290 RepID=UPI0012FC6720|nr:DUF1003 domain-containing protein [Microbacterium sp. MAH-37]MVQ41361.1 DUF1003 domain-containing protein [Microbacterium sp. MAH-37]